MSQRNTNRTDWRMFGVWMLCLGWCVGFWAGVIFAVIAVTS